MWAEKAVMWAARVRKARRDESTCVWWSCGGEVMQCVFRVITGCATTTKGSKIRFEQFSSVTTPRSTAGATHKHGNGCYNVKLTVQCVSFRSWRRSRQRPAHQIGAAAAPGVAGAQTCIQRPGRAAPNVPRQAGGGAKLTLSETDAATHCGDSRAKLKRVGALDNWRRRSPQTWQHRGASVVPAPDFPLQHFLQNRPTRAT